MKKDQIGRHRAVARRGADNGAGEPCYGAHPDPEQHQRNIEAHTERVEREQRELRAIYKKSEQTCGNPECNATTRDWIFLGQAGGLLCKKCYHRHLNERFMNQ